MKAFLHTLRLCAAAFAACTTIGSCTLQETFPDQGNQIETDCILTVKAIIGEDPKTRSLSLENAELVAKWTEDDLVIVQKNDVTIGQLKAKDVSDDGVSCTLQGHLTVAPAPDDELTLFYHKDPDYTKQDGTLSYIARYCDMAAATVTVKSVDESKEIATTPARFVNMQSIVQFTMVDKADPQRKLSPSHLSVTAKLIIQNPLSPETAIVPDVLSYALAIPPATYAENGEGVLYLALPNIPEEYLSLKPCFTLYITGAVGNDTYTYTKAGYPFDDGKYYNVAVKAQRRVLVDLGTLTNHYTAPDGVTLTGTLSGKRKISIADGATISLWNVTIDGSEYRKDNYANYAGLTCLGDATIILEDNSQNTVTAFKEYNPGIFVPEGKTLTIKGSGSLTANANYVAAGIGGGNNISCGNIVIDGGIITANGNYYGAGIGAGNHAACGTITINGGFIKAIGSSVSAGIGACGSKSSCQSICINNGIVLAKGGTNGAGIGSGQGTSDQDVITPSICGDIVIRGGYIAAIGGDATSVGSAGIGSGYNYSECRNILIEGGIVEAVGTHGAAGIGCGEKSYCGDITITNGVSLVAAFRGEKSLEGQYAYCIGASLNTLSLGTVTIGGVVTGSVTDDSGCYIYRPGNP